MLEVLDGKACGTCHTELFMKIPGSHSSVARGQRSYGIWLRHISWHFEGSLCLCLKGYAVQEISPVLLHCLPLTLSMCVVAHLSPPLNTSHPHVTWFTRYIYLTSLVSQMHTIHLMQQSFALMVYLHALVNNADFPSHITYLAIFITVQSI